VKEELNSFAGEREEEREKKKKKKKKQGDVEAARVQLQ
jgi:hypothetical protein